MGHHWPGADWPESNDDNTTNQGGHRDYRRPPGNDWSGWGQAFSGGSRGRRAGGPPALRHRPPPAPRQPHHRSPPHGGRRPRRLRAAGPALSPVRHADPDPAAWGAGTVGLLVPQLPGAAVS